MLPETKTSKRDKWTFPSMIFLLVGKASLLIFTNLSGKCLVRIKYADG
jgi:hypothetical protein